MKHRRFSGVWDLVGATALVRINALAGPDGAEVWAKLESNNPSGSVKDRPALAMIEAAERDGSLARGASIVEATSGNTGISLAMLSVVRGYRCMLVMPEDMASARQAMLRAYGAEMVLTPARLGMRGAVERAQQIVERRGAFMPRQFDNENNPRVHQETTAAEILEATEGQVDAFVAGVGTGGTITGVARGLRAAGLSPKVVAVEPKSSAILSGGKPGLHGIQGLGAGFVPQILDTSLLDEVIAISDPEAMKMTSRLAREEGLYVGPSSGANVQAAIRVASRMKAGQRVVTILCDSGERYQ